MVNSKDQKDSVPGPPGVARLQCYPDMGSIHGEWVDRIYRLCCRLCGNDADAEDLTQDVFVRACRKIDAFEGRSEVGTWLYAIAIQLWRHRQQRQERRKALEPLAAVQPRDLLAEEMSRIAFEQALVTLPTPLREAWIQVKAQGLKYREAAAVLEIP